MLDINSAFGLPSADNTPKPGNAQPPQPTVNPDGTISTLTTGQPEDKQRAGDEVIKQAKEFTGQAVLGIRRDITLPILKVLKDSGVVPVDTNVDATIKEVNKEIALYDKNHPDEFMHPSTVASLAGVMAIAPEAAYSTAIRAAASSGVLAALHELGKGNNYENAAEAGALGAAFGAVTVGGVKYLGRLLALMEIKLKQLWIILAMLEQWLNLKLLQVAHQLLALLWEI